MSADSARQGTGDGEGNAWGHQSPWSQAQTVATRPGAAGGGPTTHGPSKTAYSSVAMAGMAVWLVKDRPEGHERGGMSQGRWWLDRAQSVVPPPHMVMARRLQP